MGEEATKARRSGFKILAAAVGGLLLLALLAFGYWYFFLRGVVRSDDARIDGDMVDLAPRFSGTLLEVKPREGASVRKGDLLFTLDTGELDASLARAEAGIRAARAALEAARAHEQRAGRGSETEEIESARASLAGAEADLAVAEAGAAQVRAQIARARVTAPFDGVVVRRWRDPGGMIEAGTPVLTVLDPTSLRVAANIDERDLGRIAIGDPADVSIDAFPELQLRGTVEEILRATDSEFSLMPAEGVSGTFIKVAQRVPIRISLDLPDNLPLGPGLSVEVRIHVERDPRP